MILHTGNRTDIPAFYSRWFSERLKAGYVMVRNPYNQYWFVTITCYGKDIEPNVPEKSHIMQSFKQLSSIVGANNVAWRYDPIFIDDVYTLDRHFERFNSMASQLSEYTNTCVISFIDLYEKVKRNFPEIRRVSTSERLKIGQEFSSIGKKYGIAIKTCAEGEELARFGIDCSGCMSKETLETAIGSRLSLPSGYKGAREECSCILGSDIGQYDTCGHLCRYCYANWNKEAVIKNMKRHDPLSPFLIGGSLPDDEIHQARQESWLDMQLSFY